LLAMLVEEHKQVLDLRRRLEQIEGSASVLRLPPAAED